MSHGPAPNNFSRLLGPQATYCSGARSFGRAILSSITCACFPSQFNSKFMSNMKKEANKTSEVFRSFHTQQNHPSTGAHSCWSTHTHTCASSRKSRTHTHTHTHTHFLHYAKPPASGFTSNKSGCIFRPRPPVLCRGISPALSLSSSC